MRVALSALRAWFSDGYPQWTADQQATRLYAPGEIGTPEDAVQHLIPRAQETLKNGRTRVFAAALKSLTRHPQYREALAQSHLPRTWFLVAHLRTA